MGFGLVRPMFQPDGDQSLHFLATSSWPRALFPAPYDDWTSDDAAPSTWLSAMTRSGMKHIRNGETTERSRSGEECVKMKFPDEGKTCYDGQILFLVYPEAAATIRTSSE